MGFLILTVIETLTEIGLSWLVDDDRRSKPWASLCLGGMCAFSLILIPYLHVTWEGYVFAAIAAFFGFLAYVDYSWWREERERAKQARLRQL